MTKNFAALRAKISAAACARAAQRAKAMLADVSAQEVEAFSGYRVREFDESETNLAEG